MFGYNSNVLVESEDRACQQERLRHVIEQPRSHVVDLDHLVSHQRDTAHDEQHRTVVLRDFEAFVFHGVCNFSLLHHGATCCPSEKKSDDVTNHLKDSLNCFVHNFDVLNGELLKFFSWPKPPLFLLTKVQKIIEKTKCFPDYFLTKIVRILGTTTPITALYPMRGLRRS